MPSGSAKPQAGANDASPIPIVAGHPVLLQIELSFWDSIKASGNVEEYEAYLSQYPDGRFASLARTRVKSLRAR